MSNLYSCTCWAYDLPKGSCDGCKDPDPAAQKQQRLRAAEARVIAAAVAAVHREDAWDAAEVERRSSAEVARLCEMWEESQGDLRDAVRALEEARKEVTG